LVELALLIEADGIVFRAEEQFFLLWLLWALDIPTIGEEFVDLYLFDSGFVSFENNSSQFAYHC
jgi:hypothetical protein